MTTTTKRTLSPADLGILASALDDARSRYGDDDTCAHVAQVAFEEGIASNGDDAWTIAHEFMRRARDENGETSASDKPVVVQRWANELIRVVYDERGESYYVEIDDCAGWTRASLALHGLESAIKIANVYRADGL